MIDVYVPLDETLGIDRGSGVVGTRRGSDLIEIDFEGNRYDAVNIVTFADRVAHAADRHRTRYPTIARMVVPSRDVFRIGTFDGERVELLEPVGHPLLCRWLQGPCDDELAVTHMGAVAL